MRLSRTRYKTYIEIITRLLLLNSSRERGKCCCLYNSVYRKNVSMTWRRKTKSWRSSSLCWTIRSRSWRNRLNHVKMTSNPWRNRSRRYVCELPNWNVRYNVLTIVSIHSSLYGLLTTCFIVIRWRVNWRGSTNRTHSWSWTSPSWGRNWELQTRNYIVKDNGSVKKPTI